MSTAQEIADMRRLVQHDWLVTGEWADLHYAVLSRRQLARLVRGEDRQSVVLACGEVAGWVAIPGLISRARRPRCPGCCRATGLPGGFGSPKNCDDCRPLLGLDTEETR